MIVRIGGIEGVKELVELGGKVSLKTMNHYPHVTNLGERGEANYESKISEVKSSSAVCIFEAFHESRGY